MMTWFLDFWFLQELSVDDVKAVVAGVGIELLSLNLNYPMNGSFGKLTFTTMKGEECHQICLVDILMIPS